MLLISRISQCTLAITVHLNNEMLKYADEVKYLGHIISAVGGDDRNIC